MNKTKQILWIILLATGIFTLASAGLFFMNLSRAANQATLAVQAANVAIEGLQGVADESKSLIADARQQLEGFGRTSGKIMLHLDKLAGDTQREQRQYYAEMSRKTAQILDSSDVAIKGFAQSELEITANFGATFDRLNVGLNGVPLVLDQASQTLRTASGAIEALDIPAINQTLKSASETSANLSATSADVQKAVHRLTKPASMFKRILSTLLGFAGSAKAFL